MQKFVSKKGVCIGTAGKVCNSNDRRVCLKIRNIATIFANECLACQVSAGNATPMSDYIYCESNETNEQCCAGIR
jgi:hypothetical protein